MIKHLTVDQVVDLVFKSNSKRVGTFDKRTGYNYIDDEVVAISQDHGGMRGYSFNSLTNYENGKRTFYKQLENKQFVRDMVSSYTFGTSVSVYMINGKTRTMIGTVPIKVFRK